MFYNNLLRIVNKYAKVTSIKMQYNYYKTKIFLRVLNKKSFFDNPNFISKVKNIQYINKKCMFSFIFFMMLIKT